MFYLSRHIAAAGFAAITGSAFAEEVPPLSFANRAPLHNHVIKDMDMNMFGFGSEHKNGILRMKGALRDNTIGVTCEWIQEIESEDGTAVKGEAKTTHHACVTGSLPEKWSSVAAVNIEETIDEYQSFVLIDESGATEMYQALKSDEGAPETQNSLTFLREWKVEKKEVCLSMLFGEVDADPAHENSYVPRGRVDHGCYRITEGTPRPKVADFLPLGQEI